MSEPQKPKFIGVKQIAAALQVSDQTVYRRERTLGLNRCRDRICRSRFHTEQVERVLRNNGHEVVF
jgi:hypothetical protein